MNITNVILWILGGCMYYKSYKDYNDVLGQRAPLLEYILGMIFWPFITLGSIMLDIFRFVSEVITLKR